MLELVVNLVRNLCVKPFGGEETVERALYWQLKSEGVLDALIYLCQDVKENRVVRNNDLVFLEVFYYILY